MADEDDKTTITELEEKIAAARSAHMDSAAETYRQQLAELASTELSRLAEKHRTTDASLIRARAGNRFSRLTERLEESEAGLRVEGLNVNVVERGIDTTSNGTGDSGATPAADRPMFRREGGEGT